MNPIEYDRLFQEIPTDYSIDQLKTAIKALKSERKRLAGQIEDYKLGNVPAYIQDTGKWYNGLCKRAHSVDTVKFKLIRLYREMRDGRE